MDRCRIRVPTTTVLSHLRRTLLHGRRGGRVAVAATVALLVGACGTSDGEQSGFGVAADQLSTSAPTSTTTALTPEADTGELVVVATATVPGVTVSCSPPPGITATALAEPTVDLGNGCRAPAPPAGRPTLSPVPGPTANVVGTVVDGGITFNHPTYFGNPLVFTVLAQRGDWLQVMVPARPNGQLGWVRASDVELSSHRWRAEIDVTTNRLRVWQGGDLVVESGTVDGRSSTPTPLGRFYVNEKIPRQPTSAYGSWILSTSGYSDTLETFDGGLPVFAVHGTPDETQIGTDISNGCVRIPNAVVEQLAADLPVGTPVDVVAT